MSNIECSRLKVAAHLPELLELFQSLGISVEKLNGSAVRCDPAKYRETKRRWNREHPEAIALANKRCREAHPEKIKNSYARCKEANKRYVQSEKGHAAHLRANARWREAHREELRAAGRAYYARKKAQQAQKLDSL